MAAFAIPVLGLAGTVIKELFPDGTTAVLARDLGMHGISQAAIPVLAGFRLAPRCAELGGIAWNTIFLSDILLSDSVGHCPR